MKATAKRMDSRRGAGAVMAALAKKPDAPQEDEGQVVDETNWDAAINACETIDALQEVMQRAQSTVSVEQWDALCERANAKSAELTGDAQ